MREKKDIDKSFIMNDIAQMRNCTLTNNIHPIDYDNGSEEIPARRTNTPRDVERVICRIT